MSHIPVADPGEDYRRNRDSLDASVRRVLESGRYVLGAEVDAFEQEFASYLGAEAVVGVASGTDALELAMRAADIRPGDRVATASLTATATVAAIDRIG